MTVSPSLELVEDLLQNWVTAKLLDLPASIQVQLDHGLSGVLKRAELVQKGDAVSFNVQIFRSLSEYVDDLLIVRPTSDGVNDGERKLAFREILTKALVFRVLQAKKSSTKVVTRKF